MSQLSKAEEWIFVTHEGDGDGVELTSLLPDNQNKAEVVYLTHLSGLSSHSMSSSIAMVMASNLSASRLINRMMKTMKTIPKDGSK
jgi:hypothetical protein